MSDNRHPNYELLNLVGYGLAKFGTSFIRMFGCTTKTQFYEYIVERGFAERVSIVKNRQDLFDPFFENGRKGWWQKGDVYIHRKHHIDALCGDLDVRQYAEIVKMYIGGSSADEVKEEAAGSMVSPIVRSKFKMLQLTGQEAESYFMHNYKTIECFADGVLEDARLLGDGYDFQIQNDQKYYLAEVKGVKAASGSIRFTENEYHKALEYESDYGLIVVSNLEERPRMTGIFNPVKELRLEKRSVTQTQVTYHSESLRWERRI